MKWEQFSYADFLIFFNGKAVKSNNNGKYPIYGSNGIIGAIGKILYEDAIILGRVGAYCGSVMRCKNSFWASDNTIVVKTNNEIADMDYCYYMLIDAKLNNYAGGAAQPLITQTILKQRSCFLPSLDIQRHIADILSAYDDLIENNQKQIKLLEEAAMRLYKEWFVYLRFPGHETIRIVNGIPEGWGKKSINDLMTFHRGYDLTKNNMRGGSIPVVGSTSIIGYHNEFKIEGPGIVTGRSGSLGTYQFIWDNFWPHNTTLYICDFKEHNILFLYCLLQTVDFSSLNNGGAIPTLNRNTLSNIMVLEPSKDLQEKFVVLAKSFYERTLIANKKITLLRLARDKLLPRLMSGEIEV